VSYITDILEMILSEQLTNKAKLQNETCAKKATSSAAANTSAEGSGDARHIPSIV